MLNSKYNPTECLAEYINIYQFWNGDLKTKTSRCTLNGTSGVSISQISTPGVGVVEDGIEMCKGEVTVPAIL